MVKNDPNDALLSIRALLGDALQEHLTAEDLAEIMTAAVADAKLRDTPAASKARRWLLEMIDALTSEELERLKGSAGFMETLRGAAAREIDT